jgi:Ran-binding protein 1
MSAEEAPKTESSSEQPNIFASAVNAVKEAKDADGGEAVANEESTAQFAPLVQLDEVEVQNLEDAEEAMFKERAKLYRFGVRMIHLNEENPERVWLERGVGEMKILKHKEHGKTRLLMRQEKTMKIIVNHLVSPDTEIEPQGDSGKAFIWTCLNFEDGETKEEFFAVRFKEEDIANAFKKAYDEARAENGKVLKGEDAEDTSGGDALAGELENLEVKEGEKEKEEDKDKAE